MPVHGREQDRINSHGHVREVHASGGVRQQGMIPSPCGLVSFMRLPKGKNHDIQSSVLDEMPLEIRRVRTVVARGSALGCVGRLPDGA